MSGRERFKALVWSFAFLMGGYALWLVLLILIDPLRNPAGENLLGWAALQSVLMLISYGLLTWVIGVRTLAIRGAELSGREAEPGSRLGRLRGPAWFGWGLLTGLCLAALALVAAVALGGAEWRRDGGTVSAWLGALLVTGVVLLPAALAEELAFRGVPLLALSRAFGRGPALAGLAVLFGFAHAWNPGVRWLGLVNVGLAGMFLGLAFFTPGRLWSATGAHLGWNLGLAGLAAPVSGMTLPLPWLDYVPGAPAWLTGGTFGPEGGVLGTLAIGAGAVLAARRSRKEAVA